MIDFLSNLPILFFMEVDRDSIFLFGVICDLGMCGLNIFVGDYCKDFLSANWGIGDNISGPYTSIQKCPHMWTLFYLRYRICLTLFSNNVSEQGSTMDYKRKSYNQYASNGE
jgi:hypothetical protein